MSKVEGIDYRSGLPISISIREGRIAAMEDLPPIIQTGLPIVAPGFVDLQINGYSGLDFNGGNLTEAILTDVCTKVFQEGVTTFFPTVITNSDEAIKQDVSVIGRFLARSDSVAESIAGIHLEGPFISAEDGARGAHHRAYVKAPDWDLFQRFQDASLGNIRIITIAPEYPGSTLFIERCVDSGVLVAIGHSAASPEVIREAIAAGARMSTHLGNGSHAMLPRHSNYLIEQLAADELYASFIADGFHLPLAFLKTALRTKGHRALLVSDAVSLSGMPPGDYETQVGGRVTLRPDGKLHLAENPNILAGSAQMLKSGVYHLVKHHLTTLPEAWEMASIRPSSFMGLPGKTGLTVGSPADLVLFRLGMSGIEILQTYKRGEIVFDAPGDGVGA